MSPDARMYDHLPADPPFLKPPAYGASKAGVVSLTRYFARLWGPWLPVGRAVFLGLFVVPFAPGMLALEELRKWLVRSQLFITPFARLIPKPSSMARARPR